MFVPFVHNGYDTGPSLATKDGRVTSNMDLGNALWDADHIILLRENYEADLEWVGKTLADKVSHSSFLERAVVRIERASKAERGQDEFYLDMSQKFMFDTETGNIVQLTDRLAA